MSHHLPKLAWYVKDLHVSLHVRDAVMRASSSRDLCSRPIQHSLPCRCTTCTAQHAPKLVEISQTVISDTETNYSIHVSYACLDRQQQGALP
eukprot:scaffold60899_cov25-Prasinocladus_malaysianus.AAC.1